MNTKNRVRLGLIIVACLLWPATISAQNIIDKFLPKANTHCKGKLEKRYRDIPWDFTTNSKKPSSHRFIVFLHCILNNGSGVVDERWSHFLRQPAKVDLPMQRTIHHEDAETFFGGVQGQGRA